MIDEMELTLKPIFFKVFVKSEDMKDGYKPDIQKASELLGLYMLQNGYVIDHRKTIDSGHDGYQFTFCVKAFHKGISLP